MNIIPYYNYYEEFASLQYLTSLSVWKGKLPKSNKRNQRRNK